MANTRVVNVRHGEPYDVYIGRAVPRAGLEASKWANPFKVGRDGDLETCIISYADRHLPSRPDLLAALPELQGKTLACWCAPRGGVTAGGDLICHGQILASLADVEAQP
jgi:hypothetical protein